MLWVARAKLVEVLTFLRNLPKPYVMLYDLHGVDERLRTKRQGCRAASTSPCSITCCRSNVTAT